MAGLTNRNMAEISCNLRKPISETETPINVIVRYEGQKLVYSSGKKILPKFRAAGKYAVENFTSLKYLLEMNSEYTVIAKNNTYKHPDF